MSSAPPASIVIDGRMIFQDQCAGIARVTIEMVQRFPRDAAIPVKILMPSHVEAKFDISGLTNAASIIPCDAPISRPYELRDLLRLLTAANAGVFFSPYHPLAPLATRCPLVVGVHDCILESDLRLAGGRTRQWMYMANTARVLRQSHAVVVPSEATKQALPAFYRRLPTVAVCSNGVDAGRFAVPSAADVASARAALELPARYILHMGARRGHKNQIVLVEALARMSGDLSLVLIGYPDPRHTDRVRARAEELGVRHRIHEIGRVADHLLAGVFGGAEVFAFPSVSEGFGLPALEAMASGVPVVASAIPAVAEVVGGAAILVSPFDAQAWADQLQRVASDRRLAADLATRGRAVADASSWQAGATRLYEVLASRVGADRVAKGPAARPAATG